MATVNLTGEEYDALKQARAVAENEAAMLRRAVEEAKLGDQDSLARKTTEAFRDALEIVRFAIANMPTELYKHWPKVKLHAIADAIDYERIAGVTADDKTLAIELRKFASELP